MKLVFFIFDIVRPFVPIAALAIVLWWLFEDML